MQYQTRFISVLAALAFVAASPFFVAAQSPSVDDLVAKNVEAKGGLEKLHAVQSIKQTSHISMQSGSATLVAYGKRPNMLRQEISIAGQTVIMAFDGSTAWTINPLQTGSNTPIAITGPEAEAIKEQSDFESPLVDYKTKGYKIEFIGAETVAGKKVNHLKLTSKAQHVQHCYLDDASGLEVKIVSETAGGMLEQELSDWRDVNGVKVPFAIRTSSAGVTMASIAVDKVEINQPIDDAMFKMPKK
jgi:outer membrane lipoprotein-sorting protein